MGGNTSEPSVFSSPACLPQWSRPVMGGNTGPRTETVTQHQQPQWSRPVMGGNTPTIHRLSTVNRNRRNGAAR